MFPDHPDYFDLSRNTAARVLIDAKWRVWPYSEEDAPLAHADHAVLGGRLYARVQGGGAGPGSLPYTRVRTQGV